MMFEKIKEYLTEPLVQMPLRDGYPLKLYILTGEESIGCTLTQQNVAGHEQDIYYFG